MQRVFKPVVTQLAIAMVATQLAVAAPPKIITYPAGAEHRASVTLLQANGKTGRENSFYNNYRPQLVFSGEREGITCALHLTEPREKVDPGETAEVTFNCLEKFRVREGQLGFTGLEGGRLVIKGSLK